MRKLIVSAFKDGSLVRPSKSKPQFATIMVIESTTGVNKDGFLNTQKRVGFIRGKAADLATLDVKAGDNINEIFAKKNIPLVKIIRREYETAQYEGQQAKINPTTKVAVLYKGAPVFMEDIVVPASDPREDKLLIEDAATPVFAGVTGAEAGDLLAAAK